MKANTTVRATASHDGTRVDVRVWDLPTRVFHWALATAVVGLVITGQIGGELMPWHARAGYAVLTLLLFRLAWGVVGGHWSRFARFFPLPRPSVSQLRGPSASQAAGHSVLGWLSTIAFLIVLSLQVATGLVGDDRAEFAGPLNIHVSNTTARAATLYHKEIGAPLIYLQVALHILAIAAYRLRYRLRLTRAMWTGDKLMPPGVPASRDDARSRALALAVLFLCAGAVWGIVRWGANAP